SGDQANSEVAPPALPGFPLEVSPISATIAENGQPLVFSPALAGDAIAVETDGSSGMCFVPVGLVWPFPDKPRNFSKDVPASARGDNFRPSAFIMLVSPELVTIENFAAQDGQAKKTPSEPSSGFSTFSRFI